MKRLIMCSGKVYYDLAKARAEKGLQKEIAIVRLEQVMKQPPKAVIPCNCLLACVTLCQVIACCALSAAWADSVFKCRRGPSAVSQAVSDVS